MSDKPLTDFQLGNRCLVQKDYVKAVELFLRAAQTRPEERATAYVQVAECFLRSNTLAQPTTVAPGITLISAGDRRSAEYYYRLALQADPDHTSALAGLARVLPDQADERLFLLERAASLSPSYMILLDLGGFHRTHRKDFPLAYDMYRRAQEQNPRDETAYRRLNDICRRLGRADEAEVWSARWTQVKTTKRRVDGSGP